MLSIEPDRIIKIIAPAADPWPASPPCPRARSKDPSESGSLQKGAQRQRLQPATFPLLVCPPAGGPPDPTPRELGKAKMEQYGLDSEALQVLGTAMSKSRCH